MISDEVGRHIETALVVQIRDGWEDGALLSLAPKELLAAGLGHWSIPVPIVPRVHSATLQALLSQIPGLGDLPPAAVQSHCGSHFLRNIKWVQQSATYRFMDLPHLPHGLLNSFAENVTQDAAN